MLHFLLDLQKVQCKKKENGKMKKVLAVFFTTAVLLALAGCSLGEKPDKVVTAYCEALKNFDSEAASACVAN